MKPLLLAVLVALAMPAVAPAHGGEAGHEYVSSIERIVNGNGVEAETGEEGELSLTAPRGRTVVVLGSSSEPYLRFREGAIEVNDLAPTTYANDDRTIPARASVSKPPVWRHVADGRTHRWHDHRTHWMAEEPPPAVARDPGAHHHVSDWTVEGTVDGERFAIEGSLDWAEAKSGPGYEWLSLIAVAGLLVYGPGLYLLRRLRRTRATAPG